MYLSKARNYNMPKNRFEALPLDALYELLAIEVREWIEAMDREERYDS